MGDAIRFDTTEDGIAILKVGFDEQAVSPLKLLLAALAPTSVAALAFLLL